MRELAVVDPDTDTDLTGTVVNDDVTELVDVTVALVDLVMVGLPVGVLLTGGVSVPVGDIFVEPLKIGLEVLLFETVTENVDVVDPVIVLEPVVVFDTDADDVPVLVLLTLDDTVCETKMDRDFKDDDVCVVEAVSVFEGCRDLDKVGEAVADREYFDE